MADKGFGVKEVNLVGASGTPKIESPNNLNLNAVNVAISTDVSIGGTCTASKFVGALSGWILGNDGTNHYTFNGPGLNGTVNDPALTLVRGQKYIFHNRSSGHPFRIQSTPNGSAGTAYNTGVTNNDGSAPTDIIFDVPQDAPDTLYYQCTAHPNMGGKLTIGNSSSGSSSGLELVTSSVLTADVNKVRYDTNILQQDTIYRMIGVLEPTGNAYGGFNMNPSFYDTTNNTQYNDSYTGETNTSAAYHDSICGPFPEMNPPSSYSYNQIPVVYYDEQGDNSWWLRTDAQNTFAVSGMYFVAEFSTCLGPWMHMTFGSMSNRYHTGTFTGSWSLNPMSTYINNMEYGFVQGGVNIKTGSKTWLYKYT